MFAEQIHSRIVLNNLSRKKEYAEFNLQMQQNSD